MPPKKTPTSSLSGSHAAYFLSLHLTTITTTVIELLFKRALYRTLAWVRKVCSGGVSPETPAIHSSPATRLPLEVVETIIGYLAYDKRSLRACVLTCYSWYIAAVPRLHYTLTVSVDPLNRSKLRWPKPILYMHTLGLLPSVREFRIVGSCSRFSPGLFNCSVLRQFSALTNVRDLEMQYLDISKFMPRIKRYFGNFLPTVQSLALREPKGSRRQIIYFIGLFQHLQDLELLYDESRSQVDPAGDPTLIPAFAPPLRGWLKMTCFKRVGLLKDMIDLFGGLRFRYILLYDVDGMRLLLDACAKTLKVVVLDPTDPRGEQPPLQGTEALANDFVAKSSLKDFDLSRNKSLQTLRVQANFTDHASSDGLPDPTSGFLKHVLSTITSSEFSVIIIIYRDCHFRGIEFDSSRRAFFRELSQAERVEEVARHRRWFGAFREAHKVRGSKLGLCVCTRGSVGEEPVRILEEAIAEEKAEGGFNDFLFNPYAVYWPNWSRPGH
jgi:hypothetical protein